MTITDVKNYLAKLTSHVMFDYNGYSCGVDPLSRNKFVMWYGDNEKTVNSIEEVMNSEFFDGKSLTDIWNDIIELDY